MSFAGVKIKGALAALTVTAGMVAFAGDVRAEPITYGFYGISTEDHRAGDRAIGEAQLFVDVFDAGSSQVGFTFRNKGPEASTIARIYFDDGTLLGIATIDNGSAGVYFSQGAQPGNLPGGASISPAFVTTAEFLASAESPAPHNGVNPGEWVTIYFNLINGKTFDDTIAALNDGVDLRIGIHVISFASGGSESFVNVPGETTPPSGVVPEPGMIALAAGGLVSVLARTRRARRGSR